MEGFQCSASGVREGVVRKGVTRSELSLVIDSSGLITPLGRVEVRDQKKME